MTDAYALVKVLSRNHGVNNFLVLANMVRAPGEGDALFQKFQRVTESLPRCHPGVCWGNPGRPVSAAGNP